MANISRRIKHVGLQYPDLLFSREISPHQRLLAAAYNTCRVCLCIGECLGGIAVGRKSIRQTAIQDVWPPYVTTSNYTVTLILHKRNKLRNDKFDNNVSGTSKK